MKLAIMSLLTVFALNSQAASLRDILPIIIGGGLQQPSRPLPYPGHPGRPGYPGRPGNPGYPGYPGGGYPGGGGAVSCRADDRGHEEHGGGHYSCGECLQQHGECIETCSAISQECRVDGYDRSGRLVSFLGRSPDYYRAQEEAMRNCQYAYATNCYYAGCNQTQDVVSRRDCRRW